MRKYKVNKKLRGKIWYALYWDAATKKRVVESLGTRDEGEAERERLVIFARINGNAAAVTVSAYIDTLIRYLRTRAEGRSKEYRSEKLVRAVFARAILPIEVGTPARRLGDTPLADVTVDMVEDWMLLRKDTPVHDGNGGRQRSSATRHQEVTYLKSLLSLAHRRGLITKNPAADIVAPKTEVKKDNSGHVSKKLLSKAGIASLYAHAKKYRQVWRLALNTGLRRQELLNIRIHDDIDFEKRELLVRSTDTRPTKSGENRTVPLNSAAIKAIKDIGYYVWKNKWASRDYLLPQIAAHSLGQSFKRDAARAGLGPEVTMHWMRHTFASAYVNGEGTTIVEAKEIIGHSSVTVTEGYLHTKTANKHRGVDNLEF